MDLLGRLFGWETKPKPDEISPSLAQCLAGQIAAGLMIDSKIGQGIGAHEAAVDRERIRARSSLMVAGAMLAGSTSDQVALETLEMAGRAFRSGRQ